MITGPAMSDARLWVLKHAWCRRWRFDQRARMRAAVLTGDTMRLWN